MLKFPGMQLLCMFREDNGMLCLKLPRAAHHWDPRPTTVTLLVEDPRHQHNTRMLICVVAATPQRFYSEAQASHCFIVTSLHLGCGTAFVYWNTHYFYYKLLSFFFSFILLLGHYIDIVQILCVQKFTFDGEWFQDSKGGITKSSL